MSYTGPVRPTISVSQPLQEPASTSRMASDRPKRARARALISRTVVRQSVETSGRSSVTSPTRRILVNRRTSTAPFAFELAMHRLAVAEPAVEELARDAQQIGHERAAQRVSGRRALPPHRHEHLIAKDRELLRHDWLFDVQRGLKLLDGPFTRREQFEDADARRVGERAEEIGLHDLQRRVLHSKYTIYKYCNICNRAAGLPLVVQARSIKRRAFCACSRFSACSNTTDDADSITSSDTSSPRCAGRQCMN